MTLTPGRNWLSEGSRADSPDAGAGAEGSSSGGGATAPRSAPSSELSTAPSDGGERDSALPSMFTEATWNDLSALAPEVCESLTSLGALAEQLRTFHRPMGPDEALVLMDGLEALDRAVESLSVIALSVFERVGTPAEYGAKTTAALVADRLQTSEREANRRVALARDLGARVEMTGQPVEPRYPLVAGALHDGRLSAVQATVISAQLTSMPSRVGEDARLKAEEILVENAPNVRVRDLSTLFRTIMAWADPDGAEPTDSNDRNRNFITMRARRGGDWDLKGLLDPVTGGILHGLLTSRITAEGPKTEGSTTVDAGGITTTGDTRDDSAIGDGSSTSSGGQVDESSAVRVFDEVLSGQRSDAPATAAEPAPVDHRGVREDGSQVDVGNLPSVRQQIYERFSSVISHVEMGRILAGAPFALVVTAKAEDLTSEAAGAGAMVAETDAENPIPLSTARDEGLNGTVFFHLMSEKAKTVEVRTERRFANSKQLAILSSRDQGCTFPGCDSPPGWCDAHHIVPWSQQGRTDVSNLTLACGYHHRLIDRSDWDTVMLKDGRPAWVPPASIDPARRPVLHARFIAREIAETLFD